MVKTMEKNSVFATLNAVNCNEHTEKKNNLTYLSWAWAWAEVKKAYPEATYTIYENTNGWNYHTDGRTCWVKTGVTIEGIEHIEYLPVMDYKNNSIPYESVKSFDVNKAIQRSLTKACARHGLGLYIYAGEDLPESPEEHAQPRPQAQPQQTQAEKTVKALEQTGAFIQVDMTQEYLKRIDSFTSKAEVKKFMDSIYETPEFAKVRPSALQKYNSLKN